MMTTTTTTTSEPTALVRADELARRAAPRLAPAVVEVLTDALGVDPERPDGRLRRVPSAGALHPVAVYLDRRSSGRAETVRWHPKGAEVITHSHDSDRPDGTDVVVVAKPDVTVAKYGDRALPHVVLDAGYALSALVHSATAHGVAHGPTDVIDIRGVSGMPLAALRFGPGPDGDAPSPISTARAPVSSGPPPRSGPERSIVVSALEELTETPCLVPPRTTAADVGALRSRRSAPLAQLDGPVPSDRIASMLDATQPDGQPAGVEIWLATASGLSDLGGGRAASVRSGDRRPELAAAAAGQIELADVVLFGAPPARELTPSEFLRTRFDIAHLGYGLCVRARGHGLGARPIGSWTGTPESQHWPGSGVVVHGVALGAIADHNRPSL